MTDQQLQPLEPPPGVFVVSRADRKPTEAENLVLDLRIVDKAEARTADIATLTPAKAPELLATFLKALTAAGKALAAVQYERARTERKLDRIRADLLIDQVPQILKDQGLSTPKSPLGSEDIRQAIIERDPNYQAAVDALDRIIALHELVKGKVRVMDSALSGVKRLLGENAYNWSGRSGVHAGNEDKPAEGFGRPNLGKQRF